MRQSTVADRLGIRPGVSLWFSPIEWLRLLGPLPPGVRMAGQFAGASVAVLFVSSAGSVQEFFRLHGTVVTTPQAIWMCAPTRGRSTFNRSYLDSILAGHGHRVVEEVPIDDAWTAVRISRFVR